MAAGRRVLVAWRRPSRLVVDDAVDAPSPRSPPTPRAVDATVTQANGRPRGDGGV